MESKALKVSSTPHIRSKDSIEKIMRDVIIALSPAVIVGIVHFGVRAFMVLALTVLSCVLAELLYEKIAKKPVTIKDGSAIVTGLLLGMNLPYTVPVWLPIVGGFFAIIVVKQLFGGLGQNFMNPALAARAFLLAAYPVAMTRWNIDVTASATPLGMMKEEHIAPQSADYINALIGARGGSIGEICAIALLVGGCYLIVRKVISWRIPVFYIGTFFVLSLILKRNGFEDTFPVYELLTGGLIMGAFFMATDYASSPVTPVGQIIMGVGCALISILIRYYGGYPEGVSYSILIMNMFVPMIDRYTKPRVYGRVK